MNLNELMPTNYNAVQRQRALELSKKWERTGLLEGLTGYEKGNMAQLLENQARQLVTEANATGTSSSSEEWAGIALPLVRRVFHELSSKEFVSVQPMNLPSGLVFWLDFKYGTGQAGFNTGAGKNSQNDSLYGITDANRGSDTALYGDATPAQGLYGAGRFGYTINDYTSSALSPHASTYNSTQYVTGSVSEVDYNFNSAFSQSLVVGGSSLLKVTISTASLSNYDPNGTRAFTLSGTGVNEVFQEFTKYTAASGKIVFIISGSGLVTDLKVNYHKQPTDTTRGDFEVGKTQEATIDIPELNMEIRSEAITAKTRKIKARWTPEFAQDIDAYQNIDTEAEITSIMGEYISQEVDWEILDMLISNAPATEYWSARMGYEYNGSSAFALTSNNYAAYTQGSWFQTLGTKIQKLSNRIHSATLRGGANFIVCSPTVATILESIPGYAADTDGDKFKFAFGVQKIGAINSRYQVYKNPYMTENLILMGFRGSNYLETGAVYAPYIPLIMTQTIPDPDTFEPRKGALTRYAKKMTRPEFYGKIYVHGLNTL